MSADLLWAGDSLQADAVYYAGERRSECPLCPPWTVACVHYAGNTVRLDQRDEAWHSCPPEPFVLVRRSPSDSHAVFGPGVPTPCMLGCGRLMFSLADPATPHATEADARREFGRRCAILMGRDPDDPRDDAPVSLQDEARWSAADYTAALARQEARRRGER